MVLKILKKFFKVVFIFETERDTAWEGEGQRKRETKSEVSSRLWAVSTETVVGLKPTNHEIITWAKFGHSTDRATQVPYKFKIFCIRLMVKTMKYSTVVTQKCVIKKSKIPISKTSYHTHTRTRARIQYSKIRIMGLGSYGTTRK